MTIISEAGNGRQPYQWQSHSSFSTNVTGFLKISLNVTFYILNIYNQNKEWELAITLTVFKIGSSSLELPKIIGNAVKNCIVLLMWSQ